MPIHVDIRINEQLINQIHIGRTSGGNRPDHVNTYLVVEGEEPIRVTDWMERGTEYLHRYGDGAEVCVLKALTALYPTPTTEGASS
jgi:hypothetical protein